MIHKKKLLTAVFSLLFICSYAQLRVGDPGVKFDESKKDSDFPQMAKWQTAGVRGGIPFINDLKIKETLYDGAKSSAINAAITKVASLGGGAVLLKNGTYDIDDEVKMKSNVSLIGESRKGVKCIINKKMTRNSGAFEFLNGVKNSGIYRLTIKGGWGQPKHDWNISSDSNNELPGNENISVFFKGSTDCWIDGLDIINSADFPVRCNASHITMRDLMVDGCHNKHGGCHGYFFLLDGYNLVTKCSITRLRHISLQGGDVEYNVVYDNDFKQEVSFHSDDDGNNLIENNRITLPASMPGSQGPNYYAIMGPWSSKHSISNKPNYIYKNKCLELNKGHNNATPWSDNNKIYDGPYQVKPSNPHTNFRAMPSNKIPIGGTLYPIILNGGSGSNNKPVVNFTKPNNNQTFKAGDNVVVNVAATDDESVANVKLYLNGILIRQESTSPYDWGHTTTLDPKLKNMAAGNYTLKAVAEDNKGLKSEKSIIITVGSVTSNQNPYNGKVRSIPGTIEAEHYDLGGEGIAYHDATSGNSGGKIRSDDVDIESRDGGSTVGWISNGEWLEYTINAADGTYDMETRLASKYGGKKIIVKLDGLKIATVNIPKTNDWGSFRTVKISDLKIPAVSNKILRLEFDGGGVNLNWVKFTAKNVSVVKTVSLSPVHDTYLQGSKEHNNALIRIEKGNRIGYLMYDLSSISGSITDASLQMTCTGDAGNGTVNINLGNSSNWSENNLTNSNRPGSSEKIGSSNTNYAIGTAYSWKLDASKINTGGKLSLIVTQADGNDVAFAAKENSVTEPQLIIKYSTTKSTNGSENGSQSMVNAFPNPFTNELMVETGNQKFNQLRLVDLQGRIILVKNLHDNVGNQIDLSDEASSLSTGIYYLILESTTEIRSTKLLKTNN